MNNMLKKIITLFCLLILSTQMLPVEQIGAMLFSNQLQEEIPHCLDIDKEAKGKLCTLKDDLLFPSLATLSIYFKANNQAYFHFTVSLPSCHAGEIPTPPPNNA